MAKKKAGRPAKTEAESRTERVAFRVTQDELLRIEAAATRSQVSTSEYARHAVLTARAPQPPKGQTTMAAISELNRVGVNLHQLVKHLNFRTGNIPADLDALLSDIRVAIDRLASNS